MRKRKREEESERDVSPGSGTRHKSWSGQQKFSGSLSLEQADKMSSGSINEVDMF